MLVAIALTEKKISSGKLVRKPLLNYLSTVQNSGKESYLLVMKKGTVITDYNALVKKNSLYDKYALHLVFDKG
jgi:hypothetical protein